MLWVDSLCLIFPINVLAFFHKTWIYVQSIKHPSRCTRFFFFWWMLGAPSLRDKREASKMKYSIKSSNSKTIILVPYPAQGHVTPMLKLATTFLTRGFMPVMVTPEAVHRQIVSGMNDNVLCVPIPDGMDEQKPRDFFAIEAAMENNMPSHLERLVRELEEGGGEVVCMVIDLLASWAIEVANRCGIPAVGFWPAMLATYRLISSIPYMVRTGLISDTGQYFSTILWICFPKLHVISVLLTLQTYIAFLYQFLGCPMF